MNSLETLVELVLNDVGTKPELLVSCYGGAEYFTMTDRLERDFMDEVGKIAATQSLLWLNVSNPIVCYFVYIDVYILTTGLNSGVSKVVGLAVHRYGLINKSKWEPVVIGMNKWGSIAEHSRAALKKEVCRDFKN